MKLPGLENAVVPREKVTDYLLSITHPDGHAKAAFSLGHGFTVESWEGFGEALLDLVARHEVTKEVASNYGMKYVVEGTLRAPDGRGLAVRTVWLIRVGLNFPEFITAYPLPR